MIILKISVIRFTIKNLRRGLSSSLDIMSDSEEGDFLFLQLGVMFEIKRKN